MRANKARRGAKQRYLSLDSGPRNVSHLFFHWVQEPGSLTPTTTGLDKPKGPPQVQNGLGSAVGWNLLGESLTVITHPGLPEILPLSFTISCQQSSHFCCITYDN